MIFYLQVIAGFYVYGLLIQLQYGTELLKDKKVTLFIIIFFHFIQGCHPPKFSAG